MNFSRSRGGSGGLEQVIEVESEGLVALHSTEQFPPHCLMHPLGKTGQEGL